MGSLLKRTNNLILMGMIACSYMLWVIGIDTGTTSFIYNNYSYILVLSLVILTIINIGNLEKKDYLFILFCFGIFVFYTLTSPIRHSNHLINLVIPNALLLIFFFKKSIFDKVEGVILLLINLVAMGTIIFRFYKELSSIIGTASIWKVNYKIVSFWINTNTIGTAILFSVVMSTILIRSFKIGWCNVFVLPIYIASIAVLWICKTKASLWALLFYIVADTTIVGAHCLLKKMNIKLKNWWLIFVFALLFTLTPFLLYFLTRVASPDLFTERVRIWGEFFQQWLASKGNMSIGMEPFIASWKPLGTHNAFLNILRNFGILGYVLFMGTCFYWIVQKVKYNPISSIECSLLVGFLAVCVHSFMEDGLVSTYWFPIIFSFLGIALQQKSYFSSNTENMPSSEMNKKA